VESTLFCCPRTAGWTTIAVGCSQNSDNYRKRNRRSTKLMVN
jgi:hypothetical protein